MKVLFRVRCLGVDGGGVDEDWPEVVGTWLTSDLLWSWFSVQASTALKVIPTRKTLNIGTGSR